MRIGLDAKRAFANTTGLGEYSRLLIDGLNGMDQDLVLYTPVSGERTDFVRAGMKVRSGQGAFWRSFGLRKAVMQDGIDIYHGLSNEIPLNAAQWSIPTVVTIHDLLFHRYPAHYPPGDRLIYRVKTNYAIRNADAIVAPSASTRDDIVGMYGIDPGRIHVVPECSHPVFETTPDPAHRTAVLDTYGIRSPYILSVGSYTRRKNHETILRALARLDEDVRPTLLLVGSGGHLERRLRRTANELGLMRTLRFLHDLPQRDLAVLYRSASAAVYASLFEGFGIPLLEAMHAETPLISARNSSLTEVAGPGTLFFDATDTEQLAAHIRTAMTQDLGDEVQANLRHAQTFSADRMARETLAVYETVKNRHEQRYATSG